MEPTMERSPSHSTSSTVVPAEQTPLLSDSASDRTLRGNGAADSESEWSATAPMGMPLANGLLGRVASMYERAVRATEQRRRENGDIEGGRHGDEEVTPVSRLRGFFICFAVWILLFLQASNMSGMTMTQSTIARDLNSYASSMWFTTAYLIAASSLAPLVGRLATIFPPRSLVPPATGLIALGCILTAWSATFAQFVGSRVVMGLGASGVMNLAVVFVLGLVGEKRRGVFIGLVNVGFTIGVSFGAVVFGAAEPVIGWRALFWIQAPIAAAAGLALYLALPPSVGVGEQTRRGSFREKILTIDYLGAVMLTFTIVLFLYGLAGDIQITPLITSAISLLVFLAVENFYATDPIIPLSVLSSRGTLLSCAAQLGIMSARWTILYYAPIFMLAVRGHAPAAAGSILIPTNFGFGAGGLIVGWLHIRRGGSFWLPSAVSFALFAASMYGLSIVGYRDVSAVVVSVAVFLNGLATGAALNYTLAHVLHLSHSGTQFVTTSLMGTVRGFGGSFGTAIGGGIFYRILKRGLERGFAELDGGLNEERAELLRRLLGSPAYVFRGALSAEERAVAIEGYAGASRGTWAAAAVMGLMVVLVQLGTGWTGPEEGKRGEASDETGLVGESEGEREA